jgi:hypothetical protein
MEDNAADDPAMPLRSSGLDAEADDEIHDTVGPSAMLDPIPGPSRTLTLSKVQ